MQYTREQLLAFRSDRCQWGTEQESLDGFEARFPGGAPIDIAALIKSWLADPALDKETLYHCAAFARRAARCQVGGARLNPKGCLEKVLKILEAPPSSKTWAAPPPADPPPEV